ncbi:MULTISPECIES: hypothetical protein [unclassified Xanthobacter]|nr:MULTISPECIES: hypothetical protein [unclassified Xanthobacter]
MAAQPSPVSVTHLKAARIPGGFVRFKGASARALLLEIAASLSDT